jgi:hypothetical protein
MWVVLCEPSDHAALWAFAGLRERGLAPLSLVSPQALVCSLRLNHWIENGAAGFDIRMPNGDTLASRDIRGLLNRVAFTPTQHLAFASESERRYAAGELEALVLSLLAGLGCATVNRPSPRGLAGAWRMPAEWAVLAARSGLGTAPLRLSSRGAAAASAAGARHKVIVLGARVFGRVPRDVAQACLRLAASAETELLGIELQADAQGLRFAAADALPDLRLAGPAFIDALHQRFVEAA